MLRAAIVATLVVAAPAVAASDSANSPDGRWRAWVSTDRAANDKDDGLTSLWLTDTRTGSSRLLFRGRPAGTPERNMATFDSPKFSLDGGFVYVNADAWATSSAVHQINVRTGADRFVVAGGLVAVVRTGPYRGYLLVGQHRYRPKGGSYDPVLLFRPDGKQIMMIPDSDTDEGQPSVDRWLKAKGWTAS